MELQKGDDILNGKCTVERLIGRGGCGEVYLVNHEGLDKLYALKLLRRDVDQSWYEEVRGRFRVEARLGARIKHSHLIEVCDMQEIESQDECILVMRMEYAPGGSLQQKLEKLRAEHRKMPIADALRITLQAADGLAALHRENVVHRDVKPANILFGDEGLVKVSDLGQAQLPTENVAEMANGRLPHPGTPLYMSPEQGMPPYRLLTPASDVYALGLVLFEMLTGSAWKVQAVEQRRLDIWREEAPAWLDELLARMLAKEPEARPADGAVLAELLREGVAQEASEAQAREILRAEKPEDNSDANQGKEAVLEDLGAGDDSAREAVEKPGKRSIYLWPLVVGLLLLVMGILWMAGIRLF